MGRYVVKLPDVGEGIAEAEIVAWHVGVGDAISEDDSLVDVMTDKATVDLPSPVTGTVTWLAGEAGDVVRIGAELVAIDTAAEGAGTDADGAEGGSDTNTGAPVAVTAKAIVRRDGNGQSPPATPAPPPIPERQVATARAKPLAAPAVRRRAAALGLDLEDVAGTGPEGRIEHENLDAVLAATNRTRPTPRAVALPQEDEVTEVRVIGLRRNIAQRMQLAKRQIPHFTYVEEVDVTELERLRAELNAGEAGQLIKLTLLPFLVRAVVLAVADHPEMNARFDDSQGVVHRHRAVHLGIATQTDKGLMVPVVKDAQAHDLWDCADEITRLSNAARGGSIRVQELTGSTITITSLGALGGVVTTPVINYPEVAVIGVNKITVQPVHRDGAFVPRQVMNLSSSFDHRVVDGFPAAQFIQRIRTLLETPALLFLPT